MIKELASCRPMRRQREAHSCRSAVQLLIKLDKRAAEAVPILGTPVEPI